MTPAVRIAVLERDQGCVGWKLAFPTICGGRLELDHVRVGGMSLRSRSTEDNLAALCSNCHRWKTENGRIARPKLLEYLATVAALPALEVEG